MSVGVGGSGRGGTEGSGRAVVVRLGFVSFVVLSRIVGLYLDGGYCLGVGGGRLPGSYVFDGHILLFPLAGKDGRYLYRARSGHVRAV